MKQFVYNEIRTKDTINLLFKKIVGIVEKSPDSLNLNTITLIFIEVNR